ncbi:hypothetical protein J6524_08675 [Bradyrhizobium sp. WSM 1738]|nr:hypothetical protein [Bradyrhizobium hereditatis]MCA6114991.1 hypothetical protein [Bradyrhizobium hereditatis]
MRKPYYQFFCSEEFLQYRLVFDRSPLTRWRRRMVLDKGYRGYNASSGYTFNQGVWPEAASDATRELRRRSVVEPAISDLKSEHRLGRNYLRRRQGDATNAVLARRRLQLPSSRPLTAALLRAMTQKEIPSEGAYAIQLGAPGSEDITPEDGQRKNARGAVSRRCDFALVSGLPRVACNRCPRFTAAVHTMMPPPRRICGHHRRCRPKTRSLLTTMLIAARPAGYRVPERLNVAPVSVAASWARSLTKEGAGHLSPSLIARSLRLLLVIVERDSIPEADKAAAESDVWWIGRTSLSCRANFA